MIWNNIGIVDIMKGFKMIYVILAVIYTIYELRHTITKYDVFWNIDVTQLCMTCDKCWLVLCKCKWYYVNIMIDWLITWNNKMLFGSYMN